MYSNFSSFSRRGPDNITEELVAALSGSKSYEFKALFSVIHAALRARNAARGGEECCGCALTINSRTSCDRVRSRKPAKNTRASPMPCSF